MSVSARGFLNPFSIMKYLVVKGWLGFGDRLESLKMCIVYALHYNLQIYVDWRDPMWSHGDCDFYTYFKLVNVPVLNSLSDIPADATYHPAYWKGHLDEHITYDFVEQHKDDGLDLGILKDPFNADVVVASSIGYRTLYNSTVFSNVLRVADTRVLQKIREHKSRYPIEQSWGIHIRGTDRLKPHKRMTSIQSIVSNITVNGGMNVRHMVAVSDDKEHLEIWKRYYPSTYVASQVSVQQTASGKGNHTLDKNMLNGTKDAANVDMLVDFFILASCERIFTTIKGSRFTQEAIRLHPYVNRVLSQQ